MDENLRTIRQLNESSVVRPERKKVSNEMDKETDQRLCEIRSYVDRTRIRDKDQSYNLTSKDLLALGQFARQDFYGAIILAFFYGRAKGCRAARK